MLDAIHPLGRKNVFRFVVTISLAITLQSYWALIAGTVASRFAGVFFSYRMHPFRPRFSLDASKELFSFSSWLLLTNILLGTLHNIPLFFIGRVHGPRALGLYTVGHEIAFLPATELIAPINRAVPPGYARSSKSYLATNGWTQSRLFKSSLLAARLQPCSQTTIRPTLPLDNSGCWS